MSDKKLRGLATVYGALGGGALGAFAGSRVKRGNVGARQRRRRYEREAGMAGDVASGFYDQFQNITGADLGAIDQDIAGLDEVIGNANQLQAGISSDLQKSFNETTEGQSMMNQIAEYGRTAGNQFRNNASLMGLSDEAVVAGLGNINRTQGEGIASMAARGDERRRGLRGQSADILSLIQGANRARTGTRLSRAGMMGEMYGNSLNTAFGLMGGVDQRRAQNLSNIMSGGTTAAKLGLQAAGLPIT